MISSAREDECQPSDAGSPHFPKPDGETLVGLGGHQRDSHTFLNDMEIPVQRLDRTALEIGLSDQLRLGNSSLYLRLAHRQGMGWLGA